MPSNAAAPMATVESRAAASRDCPGAVMAMRNQRPHNGAHASTTRRLRSAASSNQRLTGTNGASRYGRERPPITLFLKADHMRYRVLLLAVSYALSGP